MKYILFLCTLLSQFYCTTLSIIFRTNRSFDIMNIALQYNPAETWVMFDCNGVLLRLSDLRLVKAIHEINSLSFSVASSIWSEEPVSLVDENTPNIIRTLQKNAYRCLLLTQRSSDTSSKIPMDIIMKKNLGSYYDFSKSWSDMPAEMVLNSPARPGKEDAEKAKYADGVIFASRSSKGEALRCFINECLKNGLEGPKCIVFVDDKIEKIYDVQKVAIDMGIMFIGIHYTRLREVIQDVVPDRAKLLRLTDKNGNIHE